MIDRSKDLAVQIEAISETLVKKLTDSRSNELVA